MTNPEQLKRSNIVNALSRNFNMSRDMLNRTVSSGQYTTRRAVLHASGPNESWIFLVTQEDCMEPTFVTAYFTENGVTTKYELAATDGGFDVGPTAVIRYVTQWFRQRMRQVEAFSDPKVTQEMKQLLAEITQPHKDTVYSRSTVRGIEESDNGLVAQMLYKSESTTISGRIYKIIILRVQDYDGRDELYKAAFYTGASLDILSPVFGKVISCYNNGDHAGMLLALQDQNNSAGIYKLEKEDYPVSHTCVNITAPKCYDPTDPKTMLRDTTFTFLNTYRVVDSDAAIDDNKYLTLINDNGEEVARRATHFVELPRKDR
jgi:hypothetical protein